MHRTIVCYIIIIGGLLFAFNSHPFHGSQYLWSHKYKEGDIKPFRGGRTARQEYAKKHVTKTMRYMNFQEMRERKDLLVSYNDKYTAIKYLEKMIPLCNDLEEKGNIILELADLNFDCGNLKDAELRYKEFYTFYPGNKSIEYAHYKAILCSFHTIYSPDRDQTKTKETITLTTDFLKNNERFSTYRKEVLNVHNKCQKHIFDSEASIFNFYLNSNSFKAAQKRLEKLEKDFSATLPDAPILIAQFKQTFVEKQRELGLQPTLQFSNDHTVIFSGLMAEEAAAKKAKEEETKLAAATEKHTADRL